MTKNNLHDILDQLSKPVEELARDAWVEADNIWMFVSDLISENKIPEIMKEVQKWIISSVEDRARIGESDKPVWYISQTMLDKLINKLCASWQLWFQKFWNIIKKTNFIDEPDEDWLTFLNFLVFNSAGNRFSDILEKVLILWANPNWFFNGENLLHIATQYWNIKVAYLLVKYWADPTARNKSWTSSLTIAKINGSQEMINVLKSSDIFKMKYEKLLSELKLKGFNWIDLLLLMSYDLDAERSWDPWIIQFCYRDDDVMGALIDCWVDVNVRDSKNWWSSLMFATYNWHVKMIKMLLAAWADINVQWKQGKTALDIANTQGIEEVKKILRYAQIEDSFLKDLWKSWFSAIWHIITSAQDINAPDINDNTLLQLLSCSSHVDLLKKCIGYWADLDYRENWGMTSLMLAARMWNQQNVEILLNAGANPNITVKWWINMHYKHRKKPMQRDLMDAADFAEFSWHPFLAKLIRNSKKYSRGSLIAKFKKIIN
ncbi:MAG: hypothetical protein ACD_3C00109G0004 [uncultured bacterium (gcode 4)]|uniref:Uncharacterized protein n=1 Tax=uncultured bacterium (gcode 4) TaxID=1234023 RepID=K2GXC1_9BACT|nr:MAG: hypothetical protein ACD_3C00109G0004 [uncultured bacterium (gcode 4)]